MRGPSCHLTWLCAPPHWAQGTVFGPLGSVSVLSLDSESLLGKECLNHLHIPGI